MREEAAAPRSFVPSSIRELGRVIQRIARRETGNEFWTAIKIPAVYIQKSLTGLRTNYPLGNTGERNPWSSRTDATDKLASGHGQSFAQTGNEFEPEIPSRG